jgi:uncharacterized membrane protein
MTVSLFGLDGIVFILRWLHFFFGIMWIGYLYYFNFSHGAFMAEADAVTKPGVITKLLPRTLWWFRFGALWTFLTGITILALKGHQAGSMEVYGSSWGVAILIGALFGITMFLNVFLIIWPNQQVVIKSANQVASGGSAIPEAAACGARALLASRTNTLFSIPMLFFMGAASHLPLAVTPESKLGLLFSMVGLVWAVLQLNAMKGKLGPMTSPKGVIASGFALTAVIYLIVEICLHI